MKPKAIVKAGMPIMLVLSLVICNGYAQVPQVSEEDRIRQGINAGRHEKYDEAIAAFNDAIKINPNSANTYYDRGVIYDRKGDLDRAVADFGKAIEIDPTLTDAYYNRGFAYYKKGKVDNAIADYNKTIELSANSSDAYYGRGLAYAKKGDQDKAIADYNKAIELRPNFALAYSARAMAYFTKKNYIGTMSDVNKAQALGFRSRPIKRASAKANKIDNNAITIETPTDAVEGAYENIIIIVLSILLILSLLGNLILFRSKPPRA